MRIIAMISGTSHDAIDVAVADIRNDGADLLLRPVGMLSVPYDDGLRAEVVAALPPGQVDAEAFCRLDTKIGHAFADAAKDALHTIAGGRADLVVSHGQTIFHWVSGRTALGTLQIGQPAWIAESTGLPVVADVRSRDVANGGHGAPLVSVFDHLLLTGDNPSVALNLGGIANITALEAGRDPVAFDVGPANTLLDAAMVRSTGGNSTFDADGALAASGEVDGVLLARLLAEPYYAMEPPKTTGKEHFHAAYLEEALAGHGAEISDADLLATLTELTAQTVADACDRYRPARVVAAGGGVRNGFLMERIGALLPDSVVETIDATGIDSDSKEAYAFALIGFLTVNGVPAVVPSATGARRASVLGAVLPGADGRLPQPTVPAGWQPQRLHVEP